MDLVLVLVGHYLGGNDPHPPCKVSEVEIRVEYFTSTTNTAAGSGRLLILLWTSKRASFHPQLHVVRRALGGVCRSCADVCP